MAKKILIVDDVAFVRKTLAKILTDAHYQVVGEASTGQQAIEMFARYQPDLVTMDVVMPNMSGIEVTRRLMKHFKNVKVLMISAMGQESLVMDAISVGAKDYITKPFNSSDVLKAVERALIDEEGPTRSAHAG